MSYHPVTGWLFILLLTLSVLLRLLLPLLGGNFDLWEWRHEADTYLAGANVYAQTQCNRGPPWHMVLALLRWLAPGDAAFAWSVSAFCTLVDSLMGYSVHRRFGRAACLAWMLNPIAIFIAGFHRHCDILALWFGLQAVLRLEKTPASAPLPAALPVALLLAASLVVKHVLLFYPLWLFIRGGRSWSVRWLLLLLPPAVLALVMIPYALEAPAPFIRHVLHYRSFDNAPLWNALLPAASLAYVKPAALCVAALLVLGWGTRRLPLMPQLAVYLIALVAFAPAMANQYLVIPVLGMVILGGWSFLPYTALSTVWIYGFSQDGLGYVWRMKGYPVPELHRDGSYAVIALALLGGLLHAGWRRRRRAGG